ncbi:MAG TPA: LPS export ABC transporter periplasmic protein LptC [Pseudolabrys sp.]
MIKARTDQQAAHAYWTMSRGDSARAFQSARRHSRLVRTMRIAIPLAVMAGLIVVALVTYFNPLRMLARLPINMNDLVVSGTKITMENPRMSGFTKDERAYEFTAEAAAQDLTKPDIVELRNIHGKLQMQDKSTMEMSADIGTYNTKLETLKLERNILLSSSTGNKGRLSVALVDVKKGNVVSDEPVELEMLQGKLNANRLEIVDSGDLVRFHDGVDMVMMLNNTPVPKPDGAQ